MDLPIEELRRIRRHLSDAGWDPDNGTDACDGATDVGSRLEELIDLLIAAAETEQP